MIHKNFLNKARPSTDSLTLVIKIGTSSICDEKTHFPLLSNLSMIVETILQLKARGHRVVLVTSAAVGTGLRRLNIDVKPKKLAAVQVMIQRYRLASHLEIILTALTSLLLWSLLFAVSKGYCCCWTGSFNESLWWFVRSIQPTHSSDLVDQKRSCRRKFLPLDIVAPPTCAISLLTHLLARSL